MVDRVIRIRIETSGSVNNSSKLSKALGKLGGIASAVGTTMAALTSAIVLQADKWANLTTQLKTVTNSQEELEKTQKKLVETAIATNSGLEATVNLYARLTRALSQTKVSQEDILSVTTAVNQAFIVSGATATEASSAITQLSQGLASGVLRGEEFNSIAEQGPRLLKALSDSLGVTQGQLRALAQEGKLTTSIVTQALKEQTQTIANEFALVEPTVGAALTNLETKFIEASAQINDTLKAAFGKSLTESVTKSIDFLSEELRKFMFILKQVENIELSENLIKDTQKATELEQERVRLAGVLNKVMKNQQEGFIGALEVENATKALFELNKELKETEERIAFAEGKLDLGFDLKIPSATKPGEDEETGDGTGLAAELLRQSEITKAAILTDSEAKKLAIQQAGRNARIADLTEGAELELQEVRNRLLLEKEVRDGAITQEQADLRTKIENSLVAIQERADLEQTLMRDIAAAQFAEEQSRKEEEFNIALEAEAGNEERQRAIIEERNLARIEQQKAFEDEQKTILADSQEEKLQILEAYADEAARLDDEKDKAKADKDKKTGEDILKNIGAFGKAGLKIQKAVALGQAGVSIATGLAKSLDLGFPAAIPEAIRVAAVGAKSIAAIKSSKIGSAGSIGSGTSSSGSTPSEQSQPASVQRSAGIENTQINELARELASTDADTISIDFARRMFSTITSGQIEGTVES